MKVFGDWERKESIGKGSFGEVYRVEKKDGKDVFQAALKQIEIPQHAADFNTMQREGMSQENVTEYFSDMVENVKEEIKLMYKLKGDSHIVSYEDHKVMEKKDSFGWTIQIRMELLTPISEFIEKNDISQADIVRLGIDICKALEVCSRYKIIHRDIKPENIFVSDIGTYKLGDFGIARELEQSSAGLSMKGTRGYMAPEIYNNKEKYDATVDIYSLGIVLYRYLNGGRMPFMPPFPEKIKYSDTEKSFERRYSGEILPKPAFAGEELSEIVLKACAYNSSDRYQSAADMRHALEELWGTWTDEEKGVVVPMIEKDKEPTPILPIPPIPPIPPPPVPIHNWIKICLIGACALVFAILLTVGIKSFVGLHDGDGSKSAIVIPKETAARETAAPVPTKTAPVVTKPPTPSYGPEKVVVPSFAGLTENRAKRRAKQAGFRIKIKSDYSSHTAKGKVMRQSKKKGKMVRKKTVVTITISKGKRPVRTTEPKPTPTPTKRPEKTKRPVPTPTPDGPIDTGFK